MGQESTSHLGGGDAGLNRAAHDAGTAIDDVGAAAGDDRQGWAHALGLGIGRARAQQDDAGVLRESDSGEKEDGKEAGHRFSIRRTWCPSGPHRRHRRLLEHEVVRVEKVVADAFPLSEAPRAEGFTSQKLKIRRGITICVWIGPWAATSSPGRRERTTSERAA